MGKDADILEKSDFKTFARTGDIYCLLYEQGKNILEKNGVLSYITSNKWMRAGYGSTLRKYFVENCNPLKLIDFGGYQVFENATVDTNILILKNALYQNTTHTCILSRNLKRLILLSDYFRQNNQPSSFENGNSWVILSGIEQRIKSKIEAAGIKLKDWKINIYRGVLTGFNEAFIISQETRDRLVSASSKNADIIRPILRGRDIQKFRAQWQGMYLISTHTGYKDSSGKYIKAIELKKYPAVKKHLDKYRTEIESRLDQGITPYHLRSCIYMDDFYKPKIIWGEISDKSKFAYDENNYFVEATSFLMTGESLKYLLGMVNSKLLEWYFNQIGTATGVGTNRWKKYTIELLPVIRTNTNEQKIFEELVDRAISIPIESNYEIVQKLDELVYRMYRLTDEEISFISRVDVSR